MYMYIYRESERDIDMYKYYVYVSMYMLLYMYVRIYMHMYKHVYMHVSLHLYSCGYMRTYMHECVKGTGRGIVHHVSARLNAHPHKNPVQDEELHYGVGASNLHAGLVLRRRLFRLRIALSTYKSSCSLSISLL